MISASQVTQWVTAKQLSPHEERKRGIILSAGISAATKVVQFGVNLLLIRWTAAYLGTERFGLWATLTTFNLLLGFADLGIGSGLLNGIAAARARDDRPTERSLLANGIALLTLVGAVITLAFFLVYPHLAIADLFKVKSSAARMEAAPSLAIVLVTFALNLPLSAAQKYNLALQKGFNNNLWLMAGTLVSLIGVVIGIQRHGSLPLLLLAFSGGQVAGALLTWLHCFGLDRSFLKVRLLALEFASSLARTGFQFFVVQGTTSIMMQLPPFFITFLLGAAAAGPYVVANRIAMILPMALSLALQPLWPAYADALARGEKEWVRRVFWLSFKATLGISLALGALFQWKGGALIHYWFGAAQVPDPLLLLGVGLFAVGNCLHWVTSMCLSGCGRTSGQFLIQIPAGILAIAGAMYLSHTYGTAGISVSFGVSEVLLGCGQTVEIIVFLSQRAKAA